MYLITVDVLVDLNMRELGCYGRCCDETVLKPVLSDATHLADAKNQTRQKS